MHIYCLGKTVFADRESVSSDTDYQPCSSNDSGSESENESDKEPPQKGICYVNWNLNNLFHSHNYMLFSSIGHTSFSI